MINALDDGFLSLPRSIPHSLDVSITNVVVSRSSQKDKSVSSLSLKQLQGRLVIVQAGIVFRGHYDSGSCTRVLIVRKSEQSAAILQRKIVHWVDSARKVYGNRETFSHSKNQKLPGEEWKRSVKHLQ